MFLDDSKGEEATRTPDPMDSKRNPIPMEPFSDPKLWTHPATVIGASQNEQTPTAMIGASENEQTMPKTDSRHDTSIVNENRTDTQSLLDIIESDEGINDILSDGSRSFLSLEDISLQRDHSKMLSPEDVSSCVYALSRVNKTNLNSNVPIKDLATNILDVLAPCIASILNRKHFNRFQIQRLIYGLGVLQFRSPIVLEAVIRYIESPTRLRGYSHRGMSCLVYGVAQLGISDYYSLQPLARVILDEMKLGTFSDLDIASMLYSAAQLSWKNEDIDKLLSAEACRWDRLMYYSPKTFSSVCISLGRLQVTQQSDIDQLVNYLKAQNRVQLLDTQGLCHVAHGMRLLSVKDPELWHLLSEDAVRSSRLSCFTEQGLATLVHSFGCHVSNDDVWTKISSEIHNERCLASFQDATLMTMLAGLQHRPPDQELVIEIFQELRTRDRLSKLSSQNLTGAIVVLCSIKWKAIKFQQFIGQCFIQEMQSPLRLQTFTPQLIALTVYALGKAKTCHIASNDDLAFLLNITLDYKMASAFTPQGWTCLIFGLGELRFNNYILMGQIVEEVFKMGLHRFNTFELVDVFFGLGKCGYRSKETNYILREIKSSKRRPEMNDGIITSLILALAYNQLEDEELMEWLMERVLSEEAALSMRQLLTILYALIELNYSQQEHLINLLEKIFHLVLKETWSEEERQQLPWLIHIMGCLKMSHATIWSRVLTELSQDDYRLISELQSTALTGILSALSQVGYNLPVLADRILAVLFPAEGMIQMDDRSKLKLLEFLVAVPRDDTVLLDAVLEKLHTKTRLKYLSPASMQRIASCLFKCKGFTDSQYSIWFLKELLEFNGGEIIRRLPKEEFLSLVSNLDVIADRGFPYMEDLIRALKSEFLTPQRRDNIGVKDTVRLMLAIKRADDRMLKESQIDVEPSPVF